MVEAFADAVLSGKPVPYLSAGCREKFARLDAIAASARSGKARGDSQP